MPETTVIIVDNSPEFCASFAKMLETDGRIRVMAWAADAYDAREKIKQYDPDVVAVAINLPRMDGIQFLRNIMRLRPMPVVMLADSLESSSDDVMAALEIGAVDFITKPAAADLGIHTEYSETIRNKIIAGAFAGEHIRRFGPVPVATKPPAVHLATEVGGQAKPHSKTIIAIGSSTGGTEAVAEVFAHVPDTLPGIVVAQHIPPGFSRQFANRVDQASALRVVEAEDGQAILDGHAYIAPGNYHLRVERRGGRYFCVVGQDAPVNRHRPSVDVLFDSVADQVRGKSTGIILTGMGADGARGLRTMLDKGSHTIAQDEASSLIWGMPGQAVKLGGAAEVLPLQRIAPRLQTMYASSLSKSA